MIINKLEKRQKKDGKIFVYVQKRFDICIRKGQQNTLKTMETYKLTNQTKGLENEIFYHYKSDEKGIIFCLHPKKAFSFILHSSTPNMTKKNIKLFFDKWMQTAIGPKETYNDRIQLINL